MKCPKTSVLFGCGCQDEPKEQCKSVDPSTKREVCICHCGFLCFDCYPKTGEAVNDPSSWRSDCRAEERKQQ